MKPDLDQLLKTHLHGQLDPQLGRAPRAFRARVDEPTHAMRIGHRHVGRWIAAGLAIAACLLIAVVLLSRQDPDKRDVAHDTRDTSTGASVAPTGALSPIVYTRVVTNTDGGMVLLDDNHVGRRVSRNEVHHYRWTDESGAVYEFFAPSQQDMLLAVHQQ